MIMTIRDGVDTKQFNIQPEEVKIIKKFLHISLPNKFSIRSIIEAADAQVSFEEAIKLEDF